ncbi:hypothetical protein BGW80DRAFT_856439 [Lactifluus volemus]|nr:hypothetical protein BGW80DRAFT_856439 [Lactifluus volemus]
MKSHTGPMPTHGWRLQRHPHCRGYRPIADLEYRLYLNWPCSSVPSQTPTDGRVPVVQPAAKSSSPLCGNSSCSRHPPLHPQTTRKCLSHPGVCGRVPIMRLCHPSGDPRPTAHSQAALWALSWTFLRDLGAICVLQLRVVRGSCRRGVTIACGPNSKSLIRSSRECLVARLGIHLSSLSAPGFQIKLSCLQSNILLVILSSMIPMSLHQHASIGGGLVPFCDDVFESA